MEAKNIEQKEIRPINGYLMLILIVAAWVCGIGILMLGARSSNGILIGVGIVGIILIPFLCYGLKIVNPNEAMVLTLFGNYYGTILKEGFYFVNPFSSSFNPTEPGKSGIKKTVSLKSVTLNNGIQKVNDVLGNPVIVGAVEKGCGKKRGGIRWTAIPALRRCTICLWIMWIIRRGVNTSEVC